MRTLLLTGFILLFSTTAFSTSSIPYTVKEVGVRGPGFIRLFMPDKYYLLAVKNIDSLESPMSAKGGCIISVSTRTENERISVTNQTCDEVMKQIEWAVELSNKVGD